MGMSSKADTSGPRNLFRQTQRTGCCGNSFIGWQVGQLDLTCIDVAAEGGTKKGVTAAVECRTASKCAFKVGNYRAAGHVR